jgi:hypothetical protein
VLERVNRRDGFSMKRPCCSSARGASFHTKHVVVLLDANSHLEYCKPSTSLNRVILTTRTTFAFDACFVWKLAPLADEQNGFFHRISINAIEHVFNVVNPYLALCNSKLIVFKHC